MRFPPLAAVVFFAACESHEFEPRIEPATIVEPARIVGPADETAEPALTRFGDRTFVTAITALDGTDVARVGTVTGDVLLVSTGVDFVNGVQVVVPANGDSFAPAPGDDGRVVAFLSTATNLMPVRTLPFAHVFVADLARGTIELASRNDAGDEAFGDSFDPAMSADGRFVAFASAAENLAFDGGGYLQVFVRDRVDDRLELVSRDAAGLPGRGDSRAPALTQDGRAVAFDTDARLLALDDDTTRDVYVADVPTGALDLVSLGLPGSSGDAAISANGSRVVFASFFEGRLEVLVRDRFKRNTTRVSDDGGRNPAISADGRYVAFETETDVFVRDLATGALARIAPGRAPSLSAHGELIAYESRASDLAPGDAGESLDVFVQANPLFNE